MVTFKGYLHRWLAQATLLLPESFGEKVLPVLRSSAKAAIKQCTGGDTGRMCGLRWESGKFFHPNRDKDHTTGAGEAMNVLAAVSALLIKQEKAPVTNSTGGTSVGDPNAGLNSNSGLPEPPRPITTGDRVGAAILTIVILVSAIGTFAWSCLPDKTITKTESH